MKRTIWLLLTWMLLGMPTLADAIDLSPSSCSDEPQIKSIVGKQDERLYLFPTYPPECQSQDSTECRAKGYILPHDVVSIHTTCGDWAYITFINNKLQRTAGWIESKRISSSPYVPVKELAEQAHATQIELQKYSKNSTNKRNHDVCMTVAGYTSLGVLDRFNVPKDATLSEEDVERIFGKDASIYGGGDYWHIDLNGDGIPEHLMMTSQGTAHFEVGYVRSENKNAETQELQAFDNDSVDGSLIRIGEEYFFTGGNGSNLHELVRFGADGKFQSVCTFSQRTQPITNIIFGMQNPVCKIVATDGVSLVDFPRKPYEEMKTLDTLGDGNTKPLLANMSVTIDINNDGHDENVTRLSYMRPGGRGCNWTQIVTTNSTGTAVPDNKLNQLLLSFLSHGMCESNMNTFVYSGRAYIDVQVKDSDRSIYQVRGNKIETVCKFVRHTITDVANSGDVTK
jgi:hypothetical protein